MRLLLVLASVLLLAGCGASRATLAEREATIAELRTTLAAAEARQAELRTALAAARATLPDTVVVTTREACRGETVEVLETDVYFESGSAQLTPAGLARLAPVAERLKGAFAGRTIRVEGHTDANPIGARLKRTYPSNWELSAARAAAVVRHLRWTHGIDAARFEVVGLGPNQPRDTNETADGRKANRRVRIAVLPLD